LSLPVTRLGTGTSGAEAGVPWVCGSGCDGGLARIMGRYDQH